MAFDKREARKSMKSVLRSFPQDIFRNKSIALQKNLRSFLSNPPTDSFTFGPDLIVGVFAPLKDEPSLFVGNWVPEFQTAFSNLLDEEQMNFKSCKPDQLVEKDFGSFKLMVPSNESEVVIPDVLLVPGLAFTERGNRLGRGKGYYDRYLSSFNNFKIGVCFKEQVLAEIPMDSHDEKLDGLITDEKILLL